MRNLAATLFASSRQLLQQKGAGCLLHGRSAVSLSLSFAWLQLSANTSCTGSCMEDCLMRHLMYVVVFCWSVQAQSKPMREILARLTAFGEFEIVNFGDEVRLCSRDELN
jgi:hypothetical protein